MKFSLFVLLLFIPTTIFCNTTIRTIAGIPFHGGDGNLAINATFNLPNSAFVTSNNEIYIADTYSHVIRKVNKNGIISTVVGIAGSNGYSGDGNLAINAQLNNPRNVVVTNNGELLISDMFNNAIRKVDKNGIISTIAGGNGYGTPNGDGGFAINAKVNNPNFVFHAHWSNEIYISEMYTSVIRKIFSNGTIVTIAGRQNQAYYSGDGNQALQATLNFPSAVVAISNELYIADTYNNAVRRVFLDNGTISTVAGNGQCFDYRIGTTATSASICAPSAIAISLNTKDLYIADSTYCIIRRVFTNQTIATIAGNGACTYGGDYGLAKNATLKYPYGIFVSEVEEIYIADSGNRLVRKIDSNELIIPVAGRYIYDSNLAKLSYPNGCYITSSGKEMYIADTGNHVVKKLDIPTNTYSIIAGVLKNSTFNGHTGAATTITLNSPTSLAMNEFTSELYIADSQNNVIRRVFLNNGTITTIAGNRLNVDTGSMPLQTSLNYPRGIAFTNNNDNELLIADSFNHVIRKLFLHNSTISIMAGNLRQRGFRGDGQIATNALLNSPSNIAVSTQTGDVFVTDSMNFVVRQLFSNNGTIRSLTEMGSFGTAIHAVAVSEANEIYVAGFYQLKRMLPNGTVELLINSGSSMGTNFAGDDRELQYVKFNQPFQMQATTNGTLWFTDVQNHVVRKMAPRCDNYAFNSTLTQLSNSVQYQFNRICVSNAEYFLAEYVPLVEMKYQSSGVDLKTVVATWNQVQQLSISGQILDLIDVFLNNCNEQNAIQMNCSSHQVSGIVPTHLPSNFFFFTQIISTTFINYYRANSLLSLQIELQFFNTETSTVEKTEYVTQPLTTVEISGLQHSTLYNVHIVTRVRYGSGLELISLPSVIPITTQKGILPSSSVSSIQLQKLSSASLLFSWQSIPTLQQGNVPITTLQLSISTASSPSSSHELIDIIYNANTNSPSSYVYRASKYDVEYVFRIRACSSIGCGNFSDTMVVRIDSPPNENIFPSTTTTTTTTVIVAVCLFFVVVFVVIGAAIAVIVVIAMKWKNRQKLQHEKQTDIMLVELVSKEFQIEVNKLDFSNSIPIGSGASGSVFTAKYFNMDVAVKLINKYFMGVENDLSDFYNELKFLNSNTQHTNIIRFFGVYENMENNSVGLVMELCTNGSVASYISKGPIDFATKLQLIRGIANGMQYLHFHNIAHRDLKCENVLLDSNLTPKIIDFGYSREIYDNSNRSLNLTMNIGTAAYCAPEVIKYQLQNSSLQESTSIVDSLSEPLLQKSIPSNYSSNKKNLAYDKKCDVYSFAIVIYVIYFQNKHPYGENVVDNQILYQLSRNIDFRPKYDELMISPNEKWVLSLMRQCWNTKSEERPSFEQICEILNQH